MILETGNMWDIWGKTDLFCITTNSTVTKDGRLVMGRGIAQEARDSIKGLDVRLGRMVGQNYRPYSLLILNDLVREKVLQEKLGAFQIKYSFSQPAETNIIAASCACLFLHICKNPNIRVDLNFPGVGHGNLPVCEVWPIVSKLPDNVHIWCDPQTREEVGKLFEEENQLVFTQFVGGIKWENLHQPPIVTSAVAKTDGNFGMERGIKKS